MLTSTWIGVIIFVALIIAVSVFVAYKIARKTEGE
jgi:hypothetical protein